MFSFASIPAHDLKVITKVSSSVWSFRLTEAFYLLLPATSRVTAGISLGDGAGAWRSTRGAKAGVGACQLPLTPQWPDLSEWPLQTAQDARKKRGAQMSRES